MKNIFARLMLVAAIAAPMAILPACPAEEKKEEAPPPPPPPPPPPAAPTIPEYNPTGDDAALKKEGAASVTADNAVQTAKDTEAALDKAIADLEAAKAAAPAKK